MCLFPPWINYFVGNIQCKTHPQFLLKEAVFSDDFYFNFVLWASNLVQHAYLTCRFYNSVLSKDKSCPCNHRTVLHVWIVHLSATLIPWEWDVILIILSLCSNILGTWMTNIWKISSFVPPDWWFLWIMVTKFDQLWRFFPNLLSLAGRKLFLIAVYLWHIVFMAHGLPCFTQNILLSLPCNLLISSLLCVHGFV